MDSHSQNQKYLFLILVMSLILLALGFNCVNQRAEASNNISAKGESNVEFLHGAISQNELTDNLERLGIKCIIHESAGISVLSTLSVEKVRLGSSAFYGGVLAGDAIKDLHKLSANTFSLIIERAGKIYSLNLSSLSAELAGNSIKTGTTKDLLEGSVNHKEALASAIVQKTLLPGSIGKQDKELEKKLLPYDIELVIDITGSMGWVDGTGDLTKFQWCHEQVRNLAQRLAPYRKTLTVTTFNTSYQTTKGCTPDRVEQIYATIEPIGGTDLVDPLMDRLNDVLETHRPNDHPVLVVVITDGLPNVPPDPRVVNRALINFTQRLGNPDQVVVTILQIGDTFEGRDFCVDLDDNLVNEGAKYDIVDTKTFAELKQEGLVNAMIDAVVEARTNRHLSRQAKHFKHFMKSLPPPSQKVIDVDSELKTRQDERHSIEQQILGQ